MRREIQGILPRNEMERMTTKPNPFKLSDNFTALRTVHEMDDALEAYDAEFWANELKDEPIQQTKRDYAKAMHHGLDVSWPISGDTIAAIRAAG